MKRASDRFSMRCVVFLALACGGYGVQHAGADDISPFKQEAGSRGLIYAVQPWSGPTQQFQGFGVAIVDLTGNGLNDIVVMGRGDGRVGFFENTGSGFFTDRSFDGFTPKLVLPKASGIAVGDYTGDGMLDIYFTQQAYEPNELLRNEGNFNFTKQGVAAGVANEGYGESAAFADYDYDGWLDLYVVNYTFPGELHLSARRNKLYRNLGNGTFQDVGASLGVHDPGMGYAAVFSDINRNCKLDLHLVNDRGHLAGQYPNQLYRNEGDGTFTNISAGSGADIGMWAMGIAAGDFTGSGYPDFYVTNLPQVGDGYNGINPLLINQGDETFVDKCEDAGVCQFIFSWAAIFFDFNNDAWLDLYVCNQGQSNRLYKNNQGQFPTTDITAIAQIGGSSGYSFNAAVGDVTGNGALDVLLNNYGPANGAPSNVQLFINQEGTKRNWIRFNVEGVPGSANRFAIGSSIEVRSQGPEGDHWQWREIYSGGNTFKSQNELVFHFGLGDATVADEIIVRWPGCEYERVLTNYLANQTWTICHPSTLGDVNGDGVINVFDLLGLLSAWGPLQPGNEIVDLTGSASVGVFDLLELLSRWGPL